MKSEARIKIVLVVICISLPVFLFLNNVSKFRVFEPFRSTEKSNASSQLLRCISEPRNFTVDEQTNLLKTSYTINNSTNTTSEKLNNLSSPSQIISSSPTKIPDDEQKNSTIPSKITSTPTSDQHNFFNKLEASKIDKESCISRYQFSSYHKPNPHKPSTYLISKLRNYEKLHARCGPKSSLYRRTLHRLSNSNHIHENETLQCKYLVWIPTNGLGNRMLSIASAFMYALLQNRVLLVEFEADMNGLFCEPFYNSTWLLPENFPYRNQWNKLPTFENRSNFRGEAGFFESYLQVDIHHGSGDNNIHHFHCNETHTFLEKIAVLFLLSDQYFVPSLFYSSFFKEEVNRMFPEKDAVFHHLGRYLFNPSNEAWGLITRFYQAYLAKSDEKIGLQIRIFHKKKVPTRNIMSHILECTQTKNILPTLNNTTRTSLNLPFQNSSSKSKAILVASLHPEFAETLRSMYWTNPTVNGDVIGVYQPSHEEFQKFGDNMHNMKALAEIYLLSLCDVLVTSPRSTFGYVAQSLGGLKPWIMVSLERKNVPDPPCKRDFSMEPCFHVSPKYDCSGETKIDNYTNFYHHLRSCVDVGHGVKLFDTDMVT